MPQNLHLENVKKFALYLGKLYFPQKTFLKMTESSEDYLRILYI